MRNIFFVLLSILLFAACSKDMDDKLDGKWQLRAIESPEGSITVDTVWYNFQNELFKYQIRSRSTGNMRTCHGFKAIKDKTLSIQLDAYGYNSLEDLQKRFLPYTDWDTTTRTFSIEKLSGKDLILTDKGKRYIFKKF